MKTRITTPPIRHNQDTCQVKDVLARIADKWSLYVVVTLGDGELRFTELKRNIEGISQRMLTVTLRGLERDGIVTRTIYSAMPPNIAYRLTPMGTGLLPAVAPLIEWATRNRPDIARAQALYDHGESVTDDATATR